MYASLWWYIFNYTIIPYTLYVKELKGKLLWFSQAQSLLFPWVKALSINNISLQSCYHKTFPANSNFPIQTLKLSPLKVLLYTITYGHFIMQSRDKDHYTQHEMAVPMICMFHIKVNYKKTPWSGIKGLNRVFDHSWRNARSWLVH